MKTQSQNIINIPKNFDWRYYISAYKDLFDAGIRTEDGAISHYLKFGKYENRQICQHNDIPPPTPLKLGLDHNQNDLDIDFYLNEYPDVINYYGSSSSISLKDKLFHHYINYGKNEGRFKNQKDKNNFITNIKYDISEIISLSELTCPKNNLECICLLTTDKEIVNQTYNKFINHLIETTPKNKYSKKIHLKIIINQQKNQFSVDDLKKIFASVETIDLNLTKEKDIYSVSLPKNKKLPAYGLKSGPNIMFLQTMNICKKYNTCLLLETDCLLGPNWIERLYFYTKYANGFLISGATYDGLVFTKSGSPMMNHINGGTGLYATNNYVLIKLINILDDFMKNQINSNMPGLAYDYALKLLIDYSLDNTYKKPIDRQIWQFINRNYLPCKLIINCSTKQDASLDALDLYKQHEYAILHKK